MWSDPRTVMYGHGGDEQSYMAFFGFLRQSLTTGHNPFFTTYLNAPHGVNLAWETTSPLLGLVAWPFDAIWGGNLVGFNVVCALGFAATAWAAYYAVTKLMDSRIAGFVAGLLWGLSPFVIVHEGLGQVNLGILVTPPLFALLITRIFQDSDGRHWRRHAVAFAVLVVVQFYISTEILLLEGVVIAAAFVIAALLDVREARRRAADVVKLLVLTGVISVVFVGFPIYVMFHYPYGPHGQVQPVSGFITDPTNVVLPTFFELVGLPQNSHLTSVYDGGDLAEATAYIGIPLLLLSAWAAWRGRRDRFTQVAVLSAVVAFVISLGSHLAFNGTNTHIPLPWAIGLRIPILDDILPARFSLAVLLVVVFLVARLVADAVHSTRRATRALVTTGVLLSLASLVPSALITIAPSQPAFFSGDAARLPAGTTVLIAPLPSDFGMDAELWQANANDRVRILGGYIHGLERNHPATLPVTAPVLFGIQKGGTDMPDAATEAQMRAELDASGATAAVLGPTVGHDQLAEILDAVCGSPGVEDQGVLVWWSC